MEYLVIYPAVGRSKIGSVESIDSICPDLLQQVASGCVKVILLAFQLTVESQELCYVSGDHADAHSFKWKTIKTLTVCSEDLGALIDDERIGNDNDDGTDSEHN